MDNKICDCEILQENLRLKEYLTKCRVKAEEFTYWLLTQQYYIMPEAILKRARKALDEDAKNDYSIKNT